MTETIQTTAATTKGCSNCGTTGCNKLNVYDWLTNMALPAGQKPFDIVEIRFKGSRKEFFRNVNNLPLQCGDVVAVEGNPGHDIGVVSVVGELVRLQMKKAGVAENSDQIKLLYRVAKQGDIEKWNEVKELEHTVMHQTRKLAVELGLSMKLSDVEYQGDGKRATFFYTADERVDFRELIKRMADKFKIRIEMRQIGMRQEAARLGGIGSCGRELCCSTWLTDFKVVTTGAARYQNLSINQAKLAGQCGKLKCCLNYELDSYMDALKEFPESNVILETKRGKAKQIKTDIFNRILWYAYDASLTPNQDVQFTPADKWVTMDLDRVIEIIEMNKQGQKPADLVEFSEKPAVSVKKPDFADVVGQDSITRMDKKKKHKPKRKKKDNAQKGNKPQQNQKPNA